MTDIDIQQAMPRVVAPGVMECGPYFERHARGGYFMVGRRQIHWYEESVPLGESLLMTRDEALRTARHAHQNEMPSDAPVSHAVM